MSPKPVESAMVLAVLNEFGVGILEAIAIVAIVETAVKIVRASKSRAFAFNFSPPLFCFSSRIPLYGAGNTKSIWRNLLEDY
jgi:hypothetical protein